MSYNACQWNCKWENCSNVVTSVPLPPSPLPAFPCHPHVSPSHGSDSHLLPAHLGIIIQQLFQGSQTHLSSSSSSSLLPNSLFHFLALAPTHVLKYPLAPAAVPNCAPAPAPNITAAGLASAYPPISYFGGKFESDKLPPLNCSELSQLHTTLN